jgi:plasmid rolling circle replication initiator protein Rep
MQETHSTSYSESSLNTLAQNGTNISTNKIVILKGEGSELNSSDKMKGRAKRKMITNAMALSLIDVCKASGENTKLKSYWNTFHCQNKIYTHEGRQYGKYCKNRHCTVCCSIRKAEIINKYYPTLKNWESPYFVTLTIKSCKAGSLKKMLKGCIRAFKLINEQYRKRHQRGLSELLIGVKSLECNFNPTKNTYNPHLHLIVSNQQTAEILIEEWLKKWTTQYTSYKGQHKRPVENLDHDLIEIIKYGSKIFTEPDVTKKSQIDTDRSIYAAALNNIFIAMKGLRIFERFGFNLPKSEPKEIKQAKVTTDFEEWHFAPQYFDWLNTESELVLTGYSPSNELLNLLENNIDICKE